MIHWPGEMKIDCLAFLYDKPISLNRNKSQKFLGFEFWMDFESGLFKGILSKVRLSPRQLSWKIELEPEILRKFNF